jgi:hypothetical protein
MRAISIKTMLVFIVINNILNDFFSILFSYRENELLRQQLRKYVTAVQMLRRDSDSTISEEDPSLDYHSEARQYEEKLIQVADMHAELMEFNARLTMQLTNRCVSYHKSIS